MKYIIPIIALLGLLYACIPKKGETLHRSRLKRDSTLLAQNGQEKSIMSRIRDRRIDDILEESEGFLGTC